MSFIKGWAIARVDDVGNVQLGRQRSPKDHAGPHMRPYLRVANVYEDRIDIRDVMEMNFSPGEYETFALRSGDILLNEGQSKELVGRPAMYRGEVPGACFQNTLVRFRAYDVVDPRFALAVFRHYLHSGEFQRICQWTTNIAHLGSGRFAALPFPVPPLNEQRRIATKLDAIFEQTRAAKARLARLPDLLEKLKRSILAAAFRGDLTKNWRTAHPRHRARERAPGAHPHRAASPVRG